MSEYQKLAAERTRHHEGRRKVQEGRVTSTADLVGVIAEGEFAKKYGLPVDSVQSAQRDPGWDFILDGKKIDIKATSRKDGNLIVHTAAKRPLSADIYVLAIVNVGNETAEFIGWIEQKDVRVAPVRTLGYNDLYPVHFVTRSQLRPMDEL